MIVDSSAVLAVMNAEAGWRDFDVALRNAPHPRMSAATYLELAMIVDRRGDPAASRLLDRVLTRWSVEVEPLTAAQVVMARLAHRDFGRDTGHPARLTLGACLSYALAAETGEPLLFKGNDFAHTDVTPALVPLSAVSPPSPGTG